MLFRALKDKGGEKSLVSSPGKKKQKRKERGRSKEVTDGLSPAQKGGPYRDVPAYGAVDTQRTRLARCFAFSAFGHYPGLREAPRACADPLHMTPQTPPPGGCTGGGPGPPPGGPPGGVPRGGKRPSKNDPRSSCLRNFSDLKNGFFGPF